MPNLIKVPQKQTTGSPGQATNKSPSINNKVSTPRDPPSNKRKELIHSAVVNRPNKDGLAKLSTLSEKRKTMELQSQGLGQSRR